MVVMRREPALRQRGFGVIETAIIAGVVALLAVITILGLGFLRDSKADGVHAVIEQIRDAAATYADAHQGAFPMSPNPSMLSTLSDAGGLDNLREEDRRRVPGFTFVRGVHGAGGNLFAVVIKCPSSQACSQVWQGESGDTVEGNVGGVTCAAKAPQGDQLALCYQLP